MASACALAMFSGKNGHVQRKEWPCSAERMAMFSGKNIYNFAILENLRIFQNCLFTGGVVTANGICSAAFCESAALGACQLPLGGAVA